MKYVICHYRVEVKYSGSIDLYTKDELKDMALAKMERAATFTADTEEEVESDTPPIVDEETIEIDVYECNKLVYVSWNEVHEKDWE